MQIVFCHALKKKKNFSSDVYHTQCMMYFFSYFLKLFTAKFCTCSSFFDYIFCCYRCFFYTSLHCICFALISNKLSQFVELYGCAISFAVRSVAYFILNIKLFSHKTKHRIKSTTQTLTNGDNSKMLE